MKKQVENGQYKLTVEKRITALEANYKNLTEKVDGLANNFDRFMNNHWEHFKDDMSDNLSNLEAKLCKKIDENKGIPWSITIIVGLLTSLVTGLIMWVLTH